MPADTLGEPGKPVLFSYFKVYDWDIDFIADRYEMVVWHNHPRSVKNLPVLRQKNPQIKALLYRELFCILREETQLAESVGHYDWIMEHHPNWFQKDIRGNLIEVPEYPGRFMMDLGNEQWRDFWIKETMKDVKEGGWDGVFVDDALTSVKMHHLPRLRNYPTDANLQAAVYGFLKKAYEAFHAEGKLMLANVSNSYDYPGLFAQWLDVTDGIMEEHCSGSSWTWGPHVGEAQLQAMQTARKADKWYLCMTYGLWEDQSLMDLSFSTYLMGLSNKVAWSYRSEGAHSKRVPVDPVWIDEIGLPTSDPKNAGAVWLREFEGGTIFLNPTRSFQAVEYFDEQYMIAPRSFRKFIQNSPLEGKQNVPTLPEL